jgi:hypothetical protein
MNLLTNGSVNNCGLRFGPSERFETDIVRVKIEGTVCEWTSESITLPPIRADKEATRKSRG